VSRSSVVAMPRIVGGHRSRTPDPTYPAIGG
jgi:hypothetical protein